MVNEDDFKVAVTIVFALLILCLLFYAVRALCLIGSIGCCIADVCKCCTRCFCKCFKQDKEGGAVATGGAAAGALDPLHRAGNWGALMLMICAIFMSIIWQFYIGEHMDEWKLVRDAWQDNCDPDDGDYPQCAEYAATYRVSFATVIFFLGMACVCAFEPRLHDEGWDIKFFAWLGIVTLFIFAPNRVFDDHGYVWPARIGAFAFLILQQIILVDFAYTVNEKLTEMGMREGEDGLTPPLLLLLGISVACYSLAFAGIVCLFHYYTGCTNSDAFISITFIMIVIFTIAQLFSDPALGHNILVSSVVAGYAVFLTYVSVSANPVEKCNPMYSKEDNAITISVGLIIAFISISATVYFASSNVTELIHDGSPSKKKQSTASDAVTVADVLTTDASTEAGVKRAQPKSTSTDPEAGDAPDHNSHRFTVDELMSKGGDGGRGWKFNLVMALIAMYWCMTLTNWGTSTGQSKGASPTAGKVTSWINIVACWICLGLYTWTLVAPRLFPNRDFSG